MESNGEIEGLVSRSKDSGSSGKDRRVGLIFDERMCKHYDPYDQNHPECPDRIQVIWDLLNSSGLAKRCIILKAKDAEDNHLALVHTKNHINLIKNISSRNSESKRKRTAGKFNSIYFNEGSTEAASLAAGSVMEAAEKVAKGELDSAFAIVRPPGHHAEEGEPMGFCLYNNVGIATSYLLNERRELGIKKILIVDWDVHHGNGTQNMFYKDPRVLFFSVHRYDSGTFYPAGHDGSYIMTGEDSGAGHNINVPWEHGRCGDADYLAVWDHILIPVAKDFNPDMIIISAGFDAAIGDPLGGCCISPYGYSVMLDKLMEFAGGKIVMALEGGYNLNSIASSAQACVEVLLNEKPSNMLLEAYPFAATWRVIQEVRRELSPYWPILAVELPEHIICKTTQMEPSNLLAGSMAIVEKPNEILQTLRTMDLKLVEMSTNKRDVAELQSSVSLMESRITANHIDIDVTLSALMDHIEKQFINLNHHVNYVLPKRVEDFVATKRSVIVAKNESIEQNIEAKMAGHKVEIDSHNDTTREVMKALVVEEISKQKNTLVDNVSVILAQRDTELTQKLNEGFSSLRTIAERLNPMVKFITDTNDASQATLEEHDASIAQLSVRLSQVESFIVVETKNGDKKSIGKELGKRSVVPISSQHKVSSAKKLAKPLEILHDEKMDEILKSLRAMEIKLTQLSTNKDALVELHTSLSRIEGQIASNHTNIQVILSGMVGCTRQKISDLHHHVARVIMERAKDLIVSERSAMTTYIETTRQAMEAKMGSNKVKTMACENNACEAIRELVVEEFNKLTNTIVDKAMINLAKREVEVTQKVNEELSSLQMMEGRIELMVDIIKNTRDATHATLEAHDASIAQLKVHLSQLESHVVFEANKREKKSRIKDLANDSVTPVPSQLKILHDKKMEVILQSLRAMDLKLAKVLTSKDAVVESETSISRMENQITTNHTKMELNLLATMDHIEQQFSNLHQRVNCVIVRRAEDLISSERSVMAAHIEASQWIMEANMKANITGPEERDRTTCEAQRVLVVEEVSRLKGTLANNSLVRLAQVEDLLKQNVNEKFNTLLGTAERIKLMVEFIKDTHSATRATLEAHDNSIANLDDRLSKVESYVVTDVKEREMKSAHLPIFANVEESNAKQLEILQTKREQLKRKLHDKLPPRSGAKRKRIVRFGYC